MGLFKTRDGIIIKKYNGTNDFVIDNIAPTNAIVNDVWLNATTGEIQTYDGSAFITTGESLNLDNLQSAIGTNGPENSVAYPSTNVVADGTSIVDAIGDLDAAVGALESGLRWVGGIEGVTDVDIHSAIPSDTQELTGSGGQTVSLVAGDLVISTHANCVSYIYTVTASGSWVETSHSYTLNDIFFVQNDVTDGDGTSQGISAYRYTGTGFEKAGDFDFEAANSITVTASYDNTTNGNITGGTDTIESGLGKLDANQQDIQSLTGVTQGNVDLGSFTNGIITNNATIKSALQELEIDIDALQNLSGVADGESNLGVFSGSVISDNATITDALQDIETKGYNVDTTLTSIAASSGVTFTSTNSSVKILLELSYTGYISMSEISATAWGTGATDVDWSEDKMVGNFSDYTISVTTSSGMPSVTITNNDATNNLSCKLKYIYLN